MPFIFKICQTATGKSVITLISQFHEFLNLIFGGFFANLAQLRWGRGRAEAEAEDVSRGRYARHCRLTLLSCLEPILPLVLLLCIAICCYLERIVVD